MDCVTSLPCPNCNGELTFLDRYERHYCYQCGRYAPEGYGDRGAKPCPTCGGILSFVPQYDRFYCYRCNAYPPDDVSEEGAGKAESTGMSGAVQAVVVLEKAPQPQPEPRYDHGVDPPGTDKPLSEEESQAEETMGEKPPLVREQILRARKPVLLDLCKAYDLDPSGTKEQIRERLLSYLDETEAPEAAQTSEALQESAHEPEIEAPAGVATPEAATHEGPHPEEPETTAAIEEETSRVESIEEPEPEVLFEPPAAVMRETASAPAVAVVQTPAAAEHPCPTCGRELAYITRYHRWYCYHCHAYAPPAASKNACPSCGGTLRWIERYARWWCDSCRRYAPADLPGPEGAAQPAADQGVETALRTTSASAHRHGNVGSGIGLVALGVGLFVLHEVLVELPAILSVGVGVNVSPDIAFVLRTFAFLFVAAGAMIGLHSSRGR